MRDDSVYFGTNIQTFITHDNKEESKASAIIARTLKPTYKFSSAVSLRWKTSPA